MLKIVIGIVVAYVVIGLVVSKMCFNKSGIVGTLLAMLLWPAMLAGSLLAGRCGKKECADVTGVQGGQGPQGPHGQGPQGTVA